MTTQWKMTQELGHAEARLEAKTLVEKVQEVEGHLNSIQLLSETLKSNAEAETISKFQGTQMRSISVAIFYIIFGEVWIKFIYSSLLFIFITFIFY